MKKLTEEQRTELAKKALQAGSYAQYKGETYRLNAIEGSCIHCENSNTNHEHTIELENFVADRGSKVMQLVTSFDNSLEDPEIAVISFSRARMNEIERLAGELFDKGCVLLAEIANLED